MNAQEILTICRLAKAASPAQAVDEYTPDLWAMVLKGVLFADAQEALVELAGEQEWIHVSHIKARVARIRRDRLLTFGVLPNPPQEVVDNPVAYLRWAEETQRAIADGVLTERPELPAGRKLTEVDVADVFRGVNDELEDSAYADRVRAEMKGEAS